MASTYSNLKFELIGTGEQSGTWGVTTNTNIGTAIEEAITGSVDVTFASGNVTLTLTDSNATQAARNLRLNCIGTTGGDRDLIVPNIEKFYLVNNGCNDVITIKNSTGTGVAVPSGKATLVFNNATNVVDAVSYLSSLTLGGALSGTSATFSGNVTASAISGASLTLSGALSGTSATFSGNVTASAISGVSMTLSDDIIFTGTGNRITGDFSNATIANRVAFQTSTTNANTTIEVVPNGTGTSSSLLLETDAGLVNTSFAQILGSATEVSFRSGIRGTGTYQPMTLHAGGSERMRIDTSGNVGIGTIPPAWRSTQTVLSIGRNGSLSQYESGGTGILTVIVSNTFVDSANTTKYIQNGFGIAYSQRPDLGFHSWSIAPSGTAGNTATYQEAMRIDSGGNVGIGTTSPSYKLAVSDGTVQLGISPQSTIGYVGTYSNHPYGFTTNNLERMRITNSGNVGIGTTSPTSGYKLHVQGRTYTQGISVNTTTISGDITISQNGQINSNGGTIYSTSIAASTTGAGANMYIDATGFMQRSVSSIKYKTDVEDLETERSESIYQMRPVWYRSKGEMDNKEWSYYGFIAEEVAEIEPRLIHFKKNEDGTKEPEGFMYDRLTVFLVAEMKKLKTENDILKSQLSALETRIQALENA